MDSNIKALLHVQNALLTALCATHPNPNALESAFSFHLNQVSEVLQSAGDISLHVNAWAKTFRMHFPAKSASEPPA